MNVLIHMDDFYPDGSPTANRMRVFYEVLSRHGHHVVVMVPDYGDGPEQNKDILRIPTVKMKKKTTLMRMLNQLSFAFSSVLYSGKAGPADVVLTTSPPVLISMAGWLIAKMKGARLVYDVRDIWPDVAVEMGSFREGSFYYRVFAFIRNFMLKHSTFVTTVSPGKVKKLKEYAPEAEVLFVTNGLDERFLDNTYDPEVADRYDLKEGFSCVYVGNLGWAQGLTQLMHLAERAKENQLDARFVLFGSGVEEESLRQYAKEHDLDNVVFAGKLPNAQMYSVLKAAQLSFVSLVNENLKDSVPTKMFEALGVGCPVLLSAVGDAADILSASRLGAAVRPNDDEALWEAFRDLYHNREQYISHREHAQKLILEEYSRQKSALILEKACEKHLAGSKIG